jgi:hypothetical protein
MWVSNPLGIPINNFTPDGQNLPGAEWSVTNYNGMTASALSGSAHAMNFGFTANSNRGISAYDIGSGNSQFQIVSNQWGGSYYSIDFQAGGGVSPRDLRLRCGYNINVNSTGDRSTYSQGHIVFADYNGGSNSQFGHLWMDQSGVPSFVTQSVYSANLGSDNPTGRVRLQSTLNGIARPSTPIVGQIFFDLNLNLPIWCKSSAGPVWINASGTVV